MGSADRGATRNAVAGGLKNLKRLVCRLLEQKKAFQRQEALASEQTEKTIADARRELGAKEARLSHDRGVVSRETAQQRTWRAGWEVTCSEQQETWTRMKRLKKRILQPWKK